MENSINNKAFKIIKQILVTQILSIVFAIVGELYMRLLITYDWMFTNVILLNLGVVLLTLLYIIAIRLFLEGSWLNVLFISVPYVIYWFIILFEGAKFFPTHTDPNDYGVGIIGIFISMYQWISVIMASAIGTYLNKRRYKINNKS
ncbi:hypothetical protein [Clostridium ganghwense]|uniref:Uncharacterized protein n=1 Tax=Clostridium ganghwense TaxID=312089 RepID=A0ABT4CK98_9CLOT|nr:hypothetical protein [Clostridium ganghwense]MCY6369475.1 hypothetical protein [Clostridium ganghwense]